MSACETETITLPVMINVVTLFRFFRHPLFPLLALLLEKCEEATRGEVDTRTVLSSLENDVRVFIQHEKDGNKTLTTDDVEVDGLVREKTKTLGNIRNLKHNYKLYLDVKSSAGAAHSPS